MAAAATVPAEWLRQYRRPRARRDAWGDFDAVLAEETRLGAMAGVLGAIGLAMEECPH